MAAQDAIVQRQPETARFRFGWAWGTPEMRPDGVRGVGVTDLAKRTTRAVGVAIPPRVLLQMRAVSPRRPGAWVLGRLMVRKLANQKPSEYRWVKGDGSYRTPPDDDWHSVHPAPDPAAPIQELAIGPVATPGEPSGYTGEPMWNVVEVTEVGCDYNGPDLWAEWQRVTPHK
jgi:hypothetical protein